MLYQIENEELKVTCCDFGAELHSIYGKGEQKEYDTIFYEGYPVGGAGADDDGPIQNGHHLQRKHPATETPEETDQEPGHQAEFP